MSDWHIFQWAALHHPYFKYCYITSPIVLRWRREAYYSHWQWVFELAFRSPSVYLPYEVRDAYRKAHFLPIAYDDIPF
ncbi:MAG: hypothetical protein H7Z11_15735 [Verrucomicrobia bacterium]|nr:hypothetical protein [Leptolyngbya sp. ES-bin-22]